MRTTAPSTARPTVPGLAIASSAVVPDHDAGLGGAVIFVDHRPPPFDHLPFDRRRAGRGAMRDPAQRGEVVASLTASGKRSRRTNMVGTMCMWLTRCFSISRSMSSASKRGCSTMLQAEPRAAHAIGRGRGVIHRAVHQHDDRGIGLEAPILRRPAGGGRLQFGRRGPAAHALGPAGRARCVDHAAARRLGGSGIGRARGTKSSQVSTPGRCRRFRPARYRRQRSPRQRHDQHLHARRECRRRSAPADRCALTSTLAPQSPRM